MALQPAPECHLTDGAALQTEVLKRGPILFWEVTNGC
jgi:hypothetical protein